MKANTFFLGLVVILTATAMGFMYKTVQNAEIKSIAKSKHADTFNMKDYRGKVVVMNYWASWSKLSRGENKNLSRVHQVYRLNPNVIFVSISLDTDSSAWKTAREEDELIWKEQYCDFKKYDSPMAKKFQVTTLPKFFIFNKAGEKIATYTNSRDLETAVQEALK